MIDCCLKMWKTVGFHPNVAGLAKSILILFKFNQNKTDKLLTINFDFKTWDHYTFNVWSLNNFYTSFSHFSHSTVLIASKSTTKICCVLTHVRLTVNIYTVVSILESESLNAELENIFRVSVLLVCVILLTAVVDR